MGIRLLQKPSTSEMIIQEAQSSSGRSLRGDLDPPPDGGFMLGSKLVYAIWLF